MITYKFKKKYYRFINILIKLLSYTARDLVFKVLQQRVNLPLERV